LPEEVTDDALQPQISSVPEDRSGSDRLLGAFEVAAAASLGIAFLVGVVAALRQGWIPASDDALIALHVRDVPAHLPLVGAYSRFGWSHPGPMAYYYLALPYRLFASNPAGLMVGTLSLGLGGTLWAWLVARRTNRLAGALVLLAMTLVMLGRDAVDLRDPWNPYIGVLLTGTLIVIAWAAAERRPGSVFALLPLGSLLVQAHVGYAPVVAAVVLAAAVGAVTSDVWTLDRSQRPFPVTAAVGGTCLGFAMWLPPLIQQFTGDPGNLWEVVRSASGEGAPAGLVSATQLVLTAFAVPPSWLGRDFPLLTDGIDPNWTLPLLGAVPVLAVAVVVIRRDLAKARLMLVCCAAIVGSLVAISRIAGPVHEYLFAGLGVTAAVVVSLSAWVLLDDLGGTYVQRWCALGALGIVVVVCIPLTVRQTGASEPYPSTTKGVSSIVSELIADANGDPVFIEAVPEFTAYAALPGFVLALEEAGIDVVVPRDAAREFGEHRTGTPDGRTRYIVAFPGMVPGYLDDGWTLVGSYDPLPTETSEQVAALDAEVKRLFDRREAIAEQGLDTSVIGERIDENRERSYDLRAERFPLAVLRAPP
jgi:hypothetical protein